ncbi:hypothetical protein E2C01_005135 [Portunus trituberculatus]|uniref:Uncharacterized protein n=1 Tax=Portunus trituberculatus TaxID=210409 RepID=A0A5B7CTG1_PORTR|nr:hypothetical protein [Portunus trituberculatus]
MDETQLLRQDTPSSSSTKFSGQVQVLPPPGASKHMQQHSPIVGIQHNGTGVQQVLVDKHLVVLPIQLGHFNGVLSLVTPVQVAANPVQRDAVRTLHR